MTSLAPENKVSLPCRYCSVTSQSNGENPIGTAITADLWIMIEVPRPWAKDPWHNESAELLKLFQAVEKRPHLWQKVRILAIAPDRDYSQPGHRHIISYRRPSRLFAQYEASHYCVPTETLSQLVDALLFRPSRLGQFEGDRRTPTRSLFVCTHTHYDVACGRFGTPLFETLRRDYAESSEMQVWQVGHFGGHNFAPTLIDFPQGHFWGHLNAEILDALVYRRGDVTRLRSHYRGWGGLSRWGQVAERELWMQVGWSWLQCAKGERLIAQDGGKFTHRILRWLLRWVPTIRAQVLLKKLDQKRTWATVEIQAHSDRSSEMTAYEVQVEVSHTVMTQLRSGETAKLHPAQQYQATVRQSVRKTER
ncbi:sucrase ferredoxin [Oscillatoria sp. CS-180]|uniref:sucrase ferredoxin n=1 Tax=Oscillatoria sp. CS-180 TaxID=3021720 RepID=UPI00232DA963|nr:sucrase ferredoxin [Oscillatoria sp. CS-180]MDB9527039.1 sucrase ferredoxin [Oscillatoria sp. CS-180]